jgi:hypothetical protein
MYTGKELEAAAYSEMLRFSVAISVQLERIEHWKDELKKGREGWTEAARKSLFDPAIPTSRYEDHLKALRNEYESPSKMHLKSEVQFLVVAVRGVFAMARSSDLAVKADEKKVRCVQQAITSFEKAAPDVVHLRDLHEHLDELLKGKGSAYDKLPRPELGGHIALLDEDVGYHIGGKVWSIQTFATAAKDLVRDVSGCLE